MRTVDAAWSVDQRHRPGALARERRVDAGDAFHDGHNAVDDRGLL